MITCNKLPSRLMERFPDRLLREEPDTCGACNRYGKRHPDCTCNDPKVLPFAEQPLTALFGEQDITVHVPTSMLVGLGSPQDACDELAAKLNEAFNSDKVIYCEPDNFFFAISFAPVYACFKFFNEMSALRASLHTEIEAKVDEIVTCMQLTASVSQEVYA